MASKKTKEKKKIAKNKIAKSRVLARRKKIREASSMEKKQARYAHKFREKLKPIIKDPEKQRQMEENREKSLREKLEKNAEILKYLESQYEKEMQNKQDINKELEAQGHVTFQEKLAALEKQVIEKMESDGNQIENSDNIIEAESVEKTDSE